MKSIDSRSLQLFLIEWIAGLLLIVIEIYQISVHSKLQNRLHVRHPANGG